MAEETGVRNVKTTVKGNKLTIEVDLDKDYGKSKSGKTNVVATTAGFYAIPDAPQFKIGLNIIK